MVRFPALPWDFSLLSGPTASSKDLFQPSVGLPLLLNKIFSNSPDQLARISTDDSCVYLWVYFILNDYLKYFLGILYASILSIWAICFNLIIVIKDTKYSYPNMFSNSLLYLPCCFREHSKNLSFKSNLSFALLKVRPSGLYVRMGLISHTF